MKVKVMKPINKYPEYSISKHGEVHSKYRGGRILKPVKSGNGYFHVFLCKDRKRKTVKVHQLVMEAYGPPQPSPQHQINHVDGNKQNNDIENLEWTTPSENMKHAVKNGLVIAPKPFRCFDQGDVSEIKNLLSDGLKQTEIAFMYEVNKSTISRIARNQTY
jgi:hypothetical protein